MVAESRPCQRPKYGCWPTVRRVGHDVPNSRAASGVFWIVCRAQQYRQSSRREYSAQLVGDHVYLVLEGHSQLLESTISGAGYLVSVQVAGTKKMLWPGANPV